MRPLLVSVATGFAGRLEQEGAGRHARAWLGDVGFCREAPSAD